MTTLTWNNKHGVYVWRGAHKETAEEIGLTYSTHSTPDNLTYFTDDPFAALALYGLASEEVAARLAPYKADYDASFAKEWNGAPHLQPADKELMPYQEAGVAYALDRPRALLGDQPGLGKTAQAIVIANERKVKRVLVVCPASVRLQWAREIRAWSLHKRPKIYPVLKSADGVSPTAEWTIISYDLTHSATLRVVLDRGRWDMVILDEAHYLKTAEARRTRALFGGGADGWSGITRDVPYVVALTGTPLPNRPRECYTLARHLCFESIDYASEQKFKDRYNPSLPMGCSAREVVGRLPELQARLRCHFMVRRLKREVLTQLPDTTCELHYVEKDGAVREALAAEKMLDIDPAALGSAAIRTDGEAISTVRLMMGEAMAPHAIQHCKDLLDSGLEKLVVFAWHKSVVTSIVGALKPYKPVKIDGSVGAVQREIAKSTFIKDPSCRVIVGNISAMGTGVDGLQTVASHIVFAEADWVPGNNEQAIDRLFRFGQKHGVLAQFVIAEGSFSEAILARSIGKAHTTHRALDKQLV